MSGPNGSVDSRFATLPTSFSGVDSPVISSGTVQCGAWQQPVSLFPQMLQENIDGVASQCRVFITGTNVVQSSGSKQQSSLAISLTVGSVQLSASVSDAQNAQTQNPEVPVVWKSSNSHVCTVNSTGLCSLISKGQCEIDVQYPRSVIRTTPTATPSGVEYTYATLVLQVTR